MAKQVALKPEEEELIRRLGFDPEVALHLKQTAGSRLQRLTGYDRELDPIPVDGISFTAGPIKASRLVDTLSPDLRSKGYLMFLSEKNEGEGDDVVGVLKGTDQFEILRTKYTNGCNYDIGNADVIAKLKEWDERFGLVILGADYDWVFFDFKTMPEDLGKFAEEASAFCPDLLEQEYDSIDEFTKFMRKANGVYLWWD